MKRLLFLLLALAAAAHAQTILLYDSAGHPIGSVTPYVAPTPPAFSMPFVDMTQLPAANPGYSTARIKSYWSDPTLWLDPTTGLVNPACSSYNAHCGKPVLVSNCTVTGPHCAPWPNASVLPVPQPVGAFRETADFAFMGLVDPIVSPGQTSAHLHTFFGNTGITPNSTSLMGCTASTAAGGILNCTGYWVPSVIDTRTGAPVQPSSSIFYYKSGYNGIPPSAITAPPPGLRIVAGHATSTTPSGPWKFGCVTPATSTTPGSSFWASQSAGIVPCPVGSDAMQEVDLPQCWDGVNLDSPDHQSHMTNPTNGVCPPKWVAIPVISFEIHYTIKSTDDMTKWRLSSDMYDPAQPSGYSMHADWINGWDVPTMASWIANCDHAAMDCHAYVLGNGQTLY